MDSRKGGVLGDFADTPYHIHIGTNADRRFVCEILYHFAWKLVAANLPR